MGFLRGTYRGPRLELVALLLETSSGLDTYAIYIWCIWCIWCVNLLCAVTFTEAMSPMQFQHGYFTSCTLTYHSPARPPRAYNS